MGWPGQGVKGSISQETWGPGVGSYMERFSGSPRQAPATEERGKVSSCRDWGGWRLLPHCAAGCRAAHTPPAPAWALPVPDPSVRGRESLPPPWHTQQTEAREVRSSLRWPDREEGELWSEPGLPDRRATHGPTGPLAEAFRAAS